MTEIGLKPPHFFRFEKSQQILSLEVFKIFGKLGHSWQQSRKRASTPVLRLYVRPQINPQINEKVAIFLEFTNSRGHSAWPQKALESFGSPIMPL